MNSFIGRVVVAAALLFSGLGIAQPARAVDFIIEPIDYDLPAEIAAAAEDGKTLFVMFGQNGCPYCAKMHKRVFPNPDVGALYTPSFVMLELNIKGDLDVVSHGGEATTEKEYANAMRARATPLFVYFDKDGKDVLRLTGYQEPGVFMAAGRYVATAAYADGTTFLDFVRAGK
ncbi:MAG: thioredoxin fold domain-containing protein [Alphaproteobacteria bacterium]|nr:thioredoxin fold domain-containing protein [Alphaproteobacteria bacterium]